ncbi:MAG: hypothetical protein ACRD07_22040, partial [Acidimicrobiales bacterium]
TYLFSDVLGNSAYVTDGVQRALGRPPRDFTDYATRTAATGIWAPPDDRFGAAAPAHTSLQRKEQ